MGRLPSSVVWLDSERRRSAHGPPNREPEARNPNSLRVRMFPRRAVRLEDIGYVSTSSTIKTCGAPPEEMDAACWSASRAPSSAAQA